MEKLFEGIELNNNVIVDLNGRQYTPEEYFAHHKKAMDKQYDGKIIPKRYEYPTGMQFELTYRCNQRCIHCYNQSGGDNNFKEGLSLERWKELAHEAGKLGVFQCVMSGGEPTILGEGLFEIMDILDSYNIKFVLITNGMLMDYKTAKRLRKYSFSWLQVSIDGSRPELHNYVRGVDSWNKAIDAAVNVRRAGLPLVIAHAVVKKNLDYLEEMIDMAYMLGAGRIITGPFSNMGRAVLNNEQLELSKEEIKKVYAICSKKAEEYKGRMEVAVAAEEAFSLRMKLFEPNGVMLIRPNGDVKFDCISPFKIGNVNEKSLKEIWDEIGCKVWEHPRLRQYVSEIKSADDLLTVHPRINVDPDELLVAN